MNKKITTIDDLAVMIEKESRNNEKRFGALEERFDGLEGRFEKLEGRFDTLEEKFGVLEGKFTASEKRMDTMVTKQDLSRFETRILAAIGDITIEFKDHTKRILQLEKIVKP